MSKKQLAGLVRHIGECAHDGVAYGPDLRDWHERLAAILATLPEPGVVSDEAVGEIGWDGDAKAFAEFYPDRDLPLGAKLYLAPAAPAAEVVAYGIAATGILGFAQVSRCPDEAARWASRWKGGRVVPLYAAPQPAPAAQGFDAEVIEIDGRRFSIETVRTALLGLACDLAAAAKGVGND